MMKFRSLLPDTLFGRLFAATLGVICTMLLVFILLLVREHRELALLDSGSGRSSARRPATSCASSACIPRISVARHRAAFEPRNKRPWNGRLRRTCSGISAPITKSLPARRAHRATQSSHCIGCAGT
jgi:hypothetical protein